MRSETGTKIARLPLVVVCLWAWSLAVSLPSAGAAVLPLAKPLQPDAAYGRLPLRFERNVGQADAAVDFLARGKGYTVLLAGTEAVLSLRPGSGEGELGERIRHREFVVGEGRPRESGSPAVLRLQLLGANPNAPAVAEDPLPTKVNYLRGNDPAKWRTGIPTSARVRYPGIYPGIDLVYYGTQGQLEYDFVLAPGADPTAIRLRVEGAEGLALDDAGDLFVRVPAGTLRLHRPVVYQDQDGIRTPTSGGYRLSDTTEVAFTVGPYDARRPLVIDPVLSYSTYLGGSHNDFAYAIAVDASGAAYVAGRTVSSNFPTTAGAWDTTFSSEGPYYDAFVAKLIPEGSALAYATYIGGGYNDEAYAIAVDLSGAAYVAGFTASGDFPTTPGAWDTSTNGNDAFVVKLTPDGSALAYATYLGGGNFDEAHAIAVDASGAAYVTGTTFTPDGSIRPPDFPTTVGAWDRSLGAYGDAFVAKLTPDGSALSYSTYLGGSRADYPAGSAVDYGYAIAVDASGAAYVTGTTYCGDFPTTPGAYDTTPNGIDGQRGDAFVVKLTPDGSALAYATYLGGDGDDQGYAIAVDASGAAYVTGTTSSTDLPTTAGTWDTSYNGNYDAFVAMLDPDGKGLFYSSYFGGNHDDYARAIALDASGGFYVVGGTESSIPITTDALQPTIGGGVFDFRPDGFVAKFTWAGALPGVLVTATAPSATEAGLIPGTFRFTRAGDTTEPLTVYYTVGGTATPGSDYETLPSSVTIPAGQRTQDLAVTPIDDTEIEPTETVILTLTANPAYTVGLPTSAMVTIVSDEVPTVTVTAPSATATENPSSAGTFRISRDGPTTFPLTVLYTVGGTATPGSDYSALPASVTIPAGQSTQDLTVTPINDTLVEPPETVILTLTTNASYTVGTPSSATVTIISDDPIVTVTALTPTVSEEGPSNATFRFARTGATTDSLVVAFTVGGTATPGADYQPPLPTTVSFLAGQSLKDLVVTTIDDLLVEAPETVVVTLTASPNYTVGTPGSATVTITSAEKATVTVTAPSPTAAESLLSPGTFRFARTGEVNAPLTVSYTVTGTATSGSDYEPLGTSVTFLVGQATVDVPVTPRQDTLVEATETVVLTLAANPAYIVGSPSSATVTILDNDQDLSPPTITHTPVTSAAANAPLRITATITDDGRVQTVTLFYRKTGATGYTQVAMTASGSTYTGTIPGTAVTAAGLQYYLEARDAVTHVTRAPGTAPGTPYNLAVVGTTVFTDDPLLPGSTPLKAVHVTQLRTAINNLRAHCECGLAGFPWTDPILTPGSTPVRRLHLMELRTALDAVYAKKGQSHPPYTDLTLTQGQTAIKASHLNELRTHVRALE